MQRVSAIINSQRQPNLEKSEYSYNENHTLMFYQDLRYTYPHMPACLGLGIP